MMGHAFMQSPRIASQTDEPQRRRNFYRSKAGDLRGATYDIPRGDYTRFFTIFPWRKKRRPGEIEDGPSGSETLHEVLHRKMSKIAKRAFHNNGSYYNVLVANDHLGGDYERTQHLIEEGKDPVFEAYDLETDFRPGTLGVAGFGNYIEAIKTQLANTRETGTHYLQAQFLLFFGMRWSTTISRMLSVRHQCIKNGIRTIE